MSETVYVTDENENKDEEEFQEESHMISYHTKNPAVVFSAICGIIILLILCFIIKSAYNILYAVNVVSNNISAVGTQGLRY